MAERVPGRGAMNRFNEMVQTLLGIPHEPARARPGRVIRAPPSTSEDLGLTALLHEPIWRELAHELSHRREEHSQTRTENRRTF